MNDNHNNHSNHSKYNNNHGNNHHKSFGEQFLGAFWGILLSIGFGAFWVGLYNEETLISVAGGVILLIGIIESIRLFLHSKSYFRPRNKGSNNYHRKF